ncbi:MAG: molybdenum cofactor cytidylyltransferase [Thermoplasmata archaeon]|nr:molybdenum cofactor cytidylyltransferase [Thermoplasmata archaeon]
MPELVVLAAGHSSRMGHPKALTRIAGELALARIARVWREVDPSPPLVVLGAHHDDVRRALPDLDARWLRNPDPDAGRTGSLQVGLRAARADAVVVWPVDHPLASVVTLRALLAARGAWVAPTHAGRGGHPILLRGPALSAVLSAPPATPLRDVPAAVGLDVTRVPVEDAGVLANLDTPDDLC